MPIEIFDKEGRRIKPDALIRVWMSFKPVGAEEARSLVEILPEQELETAPERDGFTVVEWGGTEV